MIIVGAKSFAKEVLEVVLQKEAPENVAFFDDINLNEGNLLFNTFPIFRTLDEVVSYFKKSDVRFTIGIGRPILRKKMYDKFVALGGNFITTISSKAEIGTFDVSIGNGTNIMHGAIIANGVTIGIGCIIYYNTIVPHDVTIGDFVEVSPSVTLLGRCKIDDYSQIGANATILPDIRIGKNVIVAAGSVVTEDMPDNCMVAGVPAKIKKQLLPLEF